MKIIVPVLLLLAFNSIAQVAEPSRTFLEQHCNRCHGSEKQKGDQRFDTLPAQIKKLDDLGFADQDPV